MFILLVPLQYISFCGNPAAQLADSDQLVEQMLRQYINLLASDLEAAGACVAPLTRIDDEGTSS